MVERRKPIVTELALADALDRLVNLIEELRADARPARGDHHRRDRPGDSWSSPALPDVGSPLQREVRDIPAEIVRRVWNEGLRDYEVRVVPQRHALRMALHGVPGIKYTARASR